MTAKEFFKKLKRDIQPIHQEMLNLRLIQETYQGKLPREVLKGYGRERYLLVVPQIKQLAAAVANSPDPFMEELNLRGLPWEVLEL